MLSILIIVATLIGLATHRYLSTFWENGLLPYSFGFLFFANLFAFAYLIGFIWMFGIIAGLVVAALCYFQIIYTAGLWITGIPFLLTMFRLNSMPKVNLLVYGGFSFLVWGLVALVVINFFITPYAWGWNLIENNLWPVLVSFAGVLVVGNIARMIIMSRLLADEEI